MSERSAPLGAIEIALTMFVAAVGLLAGRSYPLWREQVVVMCPLLEVTGIPCPTCGGTRALAAVARGAWLEGLGWNPGVAVASVGAILWLPVGALRAANPSWRPSLPQRLGRRVRWTLALLLAANWVYLSIWFRG